VRLLDWLVALIYRYQVRFFFGAVLVVALLTWAGL
jgi:hypothetical protein